VLCINYYNCLDNAVKGFLALVCITDDKTTSSYVRLTTVMCVVLDGCYCQTWKFFKDKNGNVEIFHEI
jgi:hypothetical protein